MPLPENVTSAQIGFMQPTAISGLTDDALEDLLGVWLAGLTSLDPNLVRPYAQAEPVPIPDSRTTTWLSFYVKSERREWDPYIEHVGGSAEDGFAGHSILRRGELMSLQVVHYGPTSQSVSQLLYNNSAMQQNNWILARNGIKFISVDDPTAVPEKIKRQFVKRYDHQIVLRRTVLWRYPVLDLLGATGTIITDEAVESAFQVAVAAQGGFGVGPLDANGWGE